MQLCGHEFHRSSRACRRQTDVIAVDQCCAAIEAFVCRIANKPDAHVRATDKLIERYNNLAALQANMPADTWSLPTPPNAVFHLLSTRPGPAAISPEALARR